MRGGYNLRNLPQRKRLIFEKIPNDVWSHEIFIYSNKMFLCGCRIVSKRFSLMIENCPIWISLIKEKWRKYYHIDHFSSIVNSDKGTPYRKYVQATFCGLHNKLYEYLAKVKQNIQKYGYFLDNRKGIETEKYDLELSLKENGTPFWEGKMLEDCPLDTIKFFNNCVRRSENEFLGFWIGPINYISKEMLLLNSNYFAIYQMMPSLFEHQSCDYIFWMFGLSKSKFEVLNNSKSLNILCKSLCLQADVNDEEVQSFFRKYLPVILALRLYFAISFLQTLAFHPYSKLFLEDAKKIK